MAPNTRPSRRPAVGHAVRHIEGQQPKSGLQNLALSEPLRHHEDAAAGTGHEGAAQGYFAPIDSLDHAQAPLGAIQITAADICAAVDLFREGKLPKSSFIRQEQVALPDFLANRYGSDDQQSAQVESIG